MQESLKKAWPVYWYRYKDTEGSRDTHGTHTGHTGAHGHTYNTTVRAYCSWRLGVRPISHPPPQGVFCAPSMTQKNTDID